MSFRRAINLTNSIPKRGLEEFLNSAKVVGQDTVYGTFHMSLVMNRSCLEVFWTSIKKFRRFAQIVVCLVKREKRPSYRVLRLWVKKRINAPPRKIAQGQVVHEAHQTSFKWKKNWIRKNPRKEGCVWRKNRCQASFRGIRSSFVILFSQLFFYLTLAVCSVVYEGSKRLLVHNSFFLFSK